MLRPGLLRQPPVDSHSVWAVGDVGLRRRLRHRLGQHPSHLFHHPLRCARPGESDLGEPQQLWTARARVDRPVPCHAGPAAPSPAAHALHAGASCMEERCTATSRTLCPISSQVCGRVAGLAPFNSPSVAAYCLALKASGNWTLSTGGAGAGTLLASGSIPGFTPSAPHSLLLNMTGAALAVAVDGVGLASATDSTYSSGMAAIGSGYHPASWGSITLSA